MSTLEEELVHALSIAARPVVEMASKEWDYDTDLERSVDKYPDMKARLAMIDRALARAAEEKIRRGIQRGS